MLNIVTGNWAPVYLFGHKSTYIVSRKGGIVYNCKTKCTIKHIIDEDGYHKVGLYYKGRYKNMRVNRLVYISFCGDEEFNEIITDVNHIDCDIDNNDLDNLEPCSSLYNVRYSILYGRRDNKGIKCPLNKYPESTIHDILKLLEVGYSIKYISKKLNIPKTNIGDIKRGRTWVHLSKDYNLPDYIHRKDTDTVVSIIEDILEGYTNTEIAKRHDIDHKYVSLIRNRKRHSKKFSEIEQKMHIKESSTTIESDEYYIINIHL